VRRIAFITALAAEARTLHAAFGTGVDTSVTHGVLIAVAGVGAVSAGKAAAAAIEGGASALVSWGYAGGLAPDLMAGTLVVADRIVCTDGSVFSTDEHWRDSLTACISRGQPVRCASLLSAPTLLADEACKSRHFRASGAIAVDMESAAVAQVARDRGVPFLAVRAVVDTARDRLPRSIVDAIGADGKLRWVRLCLDVARAPRTLQQLLSLSGSYRTARQALTSAAVVGRLHLHAGGAEAAM
jgi:adenosylhomocysteine nucleosidase